MSQNIVSLPLNYFGDPNSPRALSYAIIYVGKPHLDPEILANRYDIKLKLSSGETIPISAKNQPVRTGSGGFPEYNGQVAQIVVGNDAENIGVNYSIKILDKNKSSKFYYPNRYEGLPLIAGSNHNLMGDKNSAGQHDDIFTRKFNTVADMKSGKNPDESSVSTSALLGKVVETLGYYSAGDGGGSVGTIKNGTHVNNGGSIITIAGTLYFEAFPYHKKQQAFDLRQFGVRGNNSDSDDDQIQNALNTKMTICGSNLHCKLTDSNRLYQYNLIYVENVIFDTSSTGNHNYHPILFASAEARGSQPISDLPAGSTSIDCTLDVEVGDLIRIHNDEPAFSSNPSERIKKGESFIIVKTKPNYIELHDASTLELRAPTATIYKKLTVGVIGTLKIIGNGFDITNIGGNETGIRYENCIHNKINGGYETAGVDHHGIHTDGCFNSDISGFNIVQDQPDDAQAVQDAGQVIYGIAIFNGETESKIHGGRVNGGKHPIDWTQNADFAGYSKNVHIYNNTISACWHSAIGTHDAQTLGLVDNNIINDCARGIEFRTPRMVARNNSIRTSRLRGVSLGEGINLTEDCSGSIIDNNDVDSKTFCIRCDTASLEMTGVEITNNKLNDTLGASSGMRIDAVLKNSNISYNRAIGTAFATRTLIDINKKMEGGVVSNNSSTGNVVTGMGKHAKISNNHRDGNGFCVNWSSEVGEDCMAYDNTSITGTPLSYGRGSRKRNTSTDSKFCLIRTTEAGYNAIDVFDPDVQIKNAAAKNTLDRLFVQPDEHLFSVRVSDAKLTIKSTVAGADGNDNGIITKSGDDYELKVGYPLLLMRVYDPILKQTRFWQM